MDNTCHVYRCTSSFLRRVPFVVFPLEVLALAFLLLLYGKAEVLACPADPVREIVVDKAAPLGSEMILDAGLFPDIDGEANPA